MPKLLKILFLSTLVITIFLLGFYFYMDSDLEIGNSEDIQSRNLQNESRGLSPDQSINPNSIVFSDYDELIQARFIEERGGIIYFTRKASENEESLVLADNLVYVCGEPTQDDEVHIDKADPGHVTFVEPGFLNFEMFSGDKIALAVMQSAKTREVIFVASDKCGN